MASHNQLGKWGENIAVELLVTKGYAIKEVNWKSGHYEIDIIATQGNRIIFVEVKTRRTPDYDPLYAVDRRKKLHMVRSAHAYLLMNDLPFEVQYDIVTIIGDQYNYEIEHIPDAFIPALTTRH